jgi:serine protease Do
VLLRPTSVRGLDLNVFDFDYDLNWCALFFSPEGAVLGRFGGRDADTAGKYHSLKGLRHSLEQALAQFHNGEVRPPARGTPRRAEDYPAATRLTANACIHCHHVYEFRREAMQEARTWKTEEVWVYPQPQNVGLTLDIDEGNRVVRVRLGSAAAQAGVQVGDRLRSVGGMTVASIADVQYALHRAPREGRVAIAWQHNGNARTAELELAAGWKKTDVSWRWSLKSLSPAPGVQGDDLTPAEKKARGLPADALALRQQAFLSPAARHAGVKIHDVIIGVDDYRPAMTARQFEAYIRLTYRVGDVVTFRILRGTERLDLPLKLAK